MSRQATVTNNCTLNSSVQGNKHGMTNTIKLIKQIVCKHLALTGPLVVKNCNVSGIYAFTYDNST